MKKKNNLSCGQRGLFLVLNTLENPITVSIAFVALEGFSKRGNGTVHTKYMKMQNRIPVCLIT